MGKTANTDERPDNESASSEKALRLAAEKELLKKEPSQDDINKIMSPEEMVFAIQELNVHQIELEMQNEELIRIQVELESVRARYFDMYELAPAGYLIVSEAGLILEANLTAATLLGVSRARLIKQRLSKYIFKEDQGLYYDNRKKLFETRNPQECELRIIKYDGTIFLGHMRAAVVMNEEVPVCRIIIDDISNLKNLVEEVSRKSKENEKTANELLKYQILLKASLESPKDMIILSIDKDYQYLFFNEAHKAAMKHAYNKTVKMGMNLLEQITSEEDIVKAKKNYDLALNGTAHSTIEEFGEKSKSYYETFYNPIIIENNRIIGATAFARDITSRVLIEKALADSKENFQNLVMFMEQGLALHEIILDPDGKPVDYVFIEINDSYTKLLGVTREMCIGKRIKEVMPKVEQYWIDIFGKVALTREPAYYENFLETTGKYYSTYSYSPKQNQFAVLVSDITARIKREEEINYTNYHDQLTGLYNRRFYEEELRRLDTERNYPLTIAMGDLNGLKLINDSFGHLMGDQLLKKVAEIITEGCRADDIIARVGGDEFVIILPKTDEKEAVSVIDRINTIASMSKVGSLAVSISFGYETKKTVDQNMEDIYKMAEDHMYKHKLYESTSVKSKVIDLIMGTLFEKNQREELHSKRVSDICEAIAQNLDISASEIRKIKLSGLIHDIGKIGIDEKVLNSNGKLSTVEWNEIKRHPEVGYRILSSVNEFSEVAASALGHHERWDGKGYPKRLAGDAIPFEARIIAIADSYDAMTSERTYKEMLSKEDAAKEIRRCSGTQFDPDIARVFVEKVLGEVW